MNEQHPKIYSFIDQPASCSVLPRCILIRGWCFGTATAVTAIRLRTREIELEGVLDLPRADVKISLSHAPHDNTGFEIRGTLPAGKTELTLEAQIEDGTWHTIYHGTAQVKGNLLPLWLRRATLSELMGLQMPAHMTYPPRPIRTEQFPTRTSRQPQPKLSIVTPSYQHAPFLAETMLSVLQQDHGPLDYVVQDGGSSDGSVAVIQQLLAEHNTDPARTIHWESCPDRGQADAIARGFSKTSGAPTDVMAWLNSDDFYLPGTLSFVADYFSRHPSIDVIYGHRIVVNRQSQEMARRFLPQHNDVVLRLNDFVPQETLFWRRRIWDKVGGVDTSFQFAMDWDLLLRFQAASARIVRVPYFLACFRVHPAQKTSAAMHTLGEKELTLLRERTHGRTIPPSELANDPRLLRYLRKSAFIEFLWKIGIRAP